MTIHDMHDAVQELERLHPDRAGIGFHASEITSTVGRRSLQSVDPLLRSAIERGVLRKQMVRNVVPFGMSSTNKAMRMYSTPAAMQARNDADGATMLPASTRDAILILLAGPSTESGPGSGSGDPSILEIASTLDLTRAAVEKVIDSLAHDGLVTSYRRGVGKTRAWKLMVKGVVAFEELKARTSTCKAESPIPRASSLPMPTHVPTPTPVDKVALVVDIVGKLEAAGMAGRVLPKDVLLAAPGGYIDTVYKHLQAAVARGLLHCASMRLRERGNRMFVVYSLSPIEVPAELRLTTEEMITQALQSSKDGLRLGELVRAAQLSESSLKSTLERMVDTGVVDVTGPGSHTRYRINSMGTQTVAHDLQTT
jgi:DNA-binding MarR family transcriptional regulator/predicted transcriptional regulator